MAWIESSQMDRGDWNGIQDVPPDPNLECQGDLVWWKETIGQELVSRVLTEAQRLVVEELEVRRDKDTGYGTQARIGGLGRLIGLHSGVGCGCVVMLDVVQNRPVG